MSRALTTACWIGVLIAALWQGSAVAADPTIVVQGNRRIDADAIREHFHPAHDAGGDAAGLDAAAVDAALKELYATGWFERVDISRSGGKLVVTVAEAPIVEKLQFEGNNQFKDKDLTGVVTSKPRGPFSKTVVHEDVERLADLYRHGGRYDARITPKTIARGDGRVDLIFEIQEGAKTTIRHLRFHGNGSFSALRLKGIVKTSESDWLSFLKSSDIYDADRIETDSELLRRFYAKNGFADVRVVAAAAYDPAEKGFVVDFTVEEGTRYRVGAVALTSRVAKIDTADLRGAVPIATGDVYNGDAVDKAVEAVVIAAGKRGYPFVAVRPRTTRDAKAGTIDLDFVLDDGAHTYVERIQAHGNTVTRDEVIRREFDIQEGDAYNRALVERAERRLKGLGLFKSVKITADKGSTSDRVVLNVEVEEDRTGNFGISGGYSTTDGIIGELTVSERNFLGRGQYVKISATIGQYVYGGQISVVEPYLLGSRASLGLDLFYKENLTNSYQSYGSTTYGAGIKLMAPVADGLTTEARYSMVNQGLSLAPALMDCSATTNPAPGCYANGEASAAVKQAALNGPYWISAMGSTVLYSTLDNAKNPHDGLRAELRQDVAGLGGDVNFYKTTGDVRYYHGFGDDVVGMVRAQGGYITPYGGQTLPFSSGFFGGPQLVRGFAVNGFGPRDLTAGTTLDNIGGSAYWATSAELQSAIPGLPQEIALKTAVFADAGSLWGYKGQTSFPSLSPSLMTVGDSRQVRSSIGSSLIWDSPFGPLRVDYAYPISKTSYDVTQRLHFGVGPF